MLFLTLTQTLTLFLNRNFTNVGPSVLSKTPLFTEQKRTYWEAMSRAGGGGIEGLHTIQANVAYYNRQKNRRQSKRTMPPKEGFGWVISLNLYMRIEHDTNRDTVSE